MDSRRTDIEYQSVYSTWADMRSPLISIITPTFNSGTKIAATVASVLSQKKGLYEFLVIDGGSTDGTLAHVYAQGPALHVLSEPDDGIYDAMNKGIRLTSGEFIYFIGAGDRLLPAVLEAVAAEIGRLPLQGETAQATLLYGNVNWSIFSRPYDGPFNRFKLIRRNICHQAIFYQRSVFERLGLYNTKYRALADWEFNIRCFNDEGVRKLYIPFTIADYEGDGLSHAASDLAFHAEFPSLIRKQYGGRMLARKARSYYAGLAVLYAREMLVKAGFRPAYKQILEALRLCRSPRIILQISSFFVLWFRIIASRLKRRIKSTFNARIRE
jgi:glycosyltransferase involved in cell wall biosynthesis